MASSPPEHTRAPDPATDSPVAFALQELTACWTQAFEAMGRGELGAVASLLDQADAHLAAAGDGNSDSPTEARLRTEAAQAHALLQHAMQSGLDGIKTELGQLRRGAKALRGYDRAEKALGRRFERNA
ncbi:MAG TPA: hypothetical protein ENI87_11760 [bacterium]|nr:hypothetical protein [bacterium]